MVGLPGRFLSKTTTLGVCGETLEWKLAFRGILGHPNFPLIATDWTSDVGGLNCLTVYNCPVSDVSSFCSSGHPICLGLA